MPKLRKQKAILDEETIAAPPETQDYNEPEIVAQISDTGIDSSPLQEEVVSGQPMPEAMPRIPLITPMVVKLEVLRVLPLLIDAIKFLQTKQPLTPTRIEIIKKRLESAAALINTTKGLNV